MTEPKPEVGLLYWVLKWFLFVPVIKVAFRPWIEGKENVPATGPAILVANHISAGDTYLLPALISRRMVFPAKSEAFQGTGLRGAVLRWFLVNVGMLPMDRSGGRASANSMAGVLGVLERGDLLGIFPEGTRSPDGRLHKGKTGVARLVLQARVPVIPVGVVDTEFHRLPVLGIPVMRRPGVRIGTPMDFNRYADAANDRQVLRWVTDEIMGAVMELSGQTYVDAYASSVKTAAREGRVFETTVQERPGGGRPAPPVPAPLPTAAPDVTP